jgi:hypothetical protein
MVVAQRAFSPLRPETVPGDGRSSAAIFFWKVSGGRLGRSPKNKKTEGGDDQEWALFAPGTEEGRLLYEF